MDAILIQAPNERAVMMLTQWLAEDGATVAENAVICELEIAWVYEPHYRHIVLEMKSPIRGVVQQLARVGTVLGSGGEICRILPSL